MAAATRTVRSSTVEPGSPWHLWALQQAAALLDDDGVRGYLSPAGRPLPDMPCYDANDRLWHHANGSATIEPCVAAPPRRDRPTPGRRLWLLPAPQHSDEGEGTAPEALQAERYAAGFRPSLALEQTAALELAELMVSSVYYGAGVPRGAGQSVLLVPGFMGSDAYLTVMGGWLRRLGYAPAYAGMALNAGPLPLLLRMVEHRAEQLAAGGRRITIVGHSLGGVFARIVATRRPELVEHVLTLGSPIERDPRQAAHPIVQALARALLCGADADATAFDALAAPLASTVRLTCLYSRRDAIVDWHACLSSDRMARNLEVPGSHMGLAWNAAAFWEIGRALAR